MSAQTIDALVQLIIAVATLVAAITACVKAVEAKATAANVAVKADVNHAETVDKLGTVVAQTNGILTASQQAVSATADQIAAVVSDVQALKSASEKGHNP
jgi:ABC-type transporter Mla subunit MlaD